MFKIIVKISKNVSNINKMVKHDCNFVNYIFSSRSLSNDTRITIPITLVIKMANIKKK